MGNILLFFIVGCLLGWILRNREKWIKSSGWVTNILLGLLILMLGISTGSNPDLAANFVQLGFSALCLAVGGIIGSILCLLPLAGKWPKDPD